MTILGARGYKAPRNELSEMGRAYVQDMQKSFLNERGETTFAYEFRAAVVARDYEALVLDPPIIEDSEREEAYEDDETDEDDDTRGH